MTDIIGRLQQLEASLIAREGFVSQDVDVCRAAVAQLRASKNGTAEKRERFDRFFAAALQGLLARSTATKLMNGPEDFVREARLVAELCVQAQRGEDS